MIFLATFTVYLLPAFSQYSVRTGLCVDVFLMSLWEEVSLLFYSVILVSSLKLGSLASFKIMWRPCNILTPNNTTFSVYVLSIQEFSSFSIPLKLDIITTFLFNNFLFRCAYVFIIPLPAFLKNTVIWLLFIWCLQYAEKTICENYIYKGTITDKTKLW